MKIRSIKKLVSEFTCSLWPLRSQEFYSEVRFNKHFFIDLWAMLQTQKYPLLPILGKFTCFSTKVTGGYRVSQK